MTHKMNLQDSPLQMIKDKTQTIELRLYDEKRQKIKEGDIICFDNDHTDEIIKAKVKKLHIYKNFHELYKHFNKVSMGYREDETANPEDMEEYYSKEKIEKYGVVGIEIEVVSE